MRPKLPGWGGGISSRLRLSSDHQEEEASFTSRWVNNGVRAQLDGTAFLETRVLPPWWIAAQPKTAFALIRRSVTGKNDDFVSL